MLITYVTDCDNLFNVALIRSIETCQIILWVISEFWINVIFLSTLSFLMSEIIIHISLCVCVCDVFVYFCSFSTMLLVNKGVQ